jgi:hypothetical protein
MPHQEFGFLIMIEFEHTLFMILLLISMLNAKPPQQKWTLIFVGIGILYTFIPPVHTLSIPWDLLLGLILPLILWQNARRLLIARWQISRKELFLWISVTLSFGVTFGLANDLSWLGSSLFGLIAASMIWRAAEPDDASSFLSQIGALMMIFLLGEVEPAVTTPNYYLGGIFSGGFFGIMVALLAVYLFRRFKGKNGDWITLGQIYLAYWLAASVGVSAVSAAIASMIVFTNLGLRYGFWTNLNPFPAPLNSWVGFSVLLVLFVFLGWQSHQPFKTILLIETGLGMILTFAAAWIGQRWNLSYFTNLPLWQVGLRVSLFVFPALLLWPRNIFQDSQQLALALGAAILMIYLASKSLPEFMDNWFNSKGSGGRT